ncbi:YihY/virulence factor BrkB family protein [Algoriphagus halophytocola]|uniref:YihY/virulence factor BrkB family protein n=1 Tax=Algoriphagus halophytocola TaxID=2991499 RepID=A0ABY6MM83_9BACT|nr:MULTISPECIES: YihY/virulence factor BrkB family protein [unclassified Algoriphagus]UZD23411.1 YihY/virulence factor BrkB family protein [Algoriphagus sp. TR-M5]WBL44706.1 YihY/virulence factor BrkB family protein [Algoriphagus sp. TR-M9]
METEIKDMNKITPSRFKVTHIPSLMVESFKQWNHAEPWRLSAVIAYYAVLSLPALMVIVINTVGAIWGVDIVTGKLTDEMASALGPETAEFLQNMVAQTQTSGKSTIASIIGIGVLIFGASGVFFHLKISINDIWGLKQTDTVKWYYTLWERAVSFSFVLVLGFLLLISFVLTALLSMFSDFIRSILPEFVVVFAFMVDFIISYGVVAVLFALIFKYLPDAKIRWKSVWIGALLTAFLFSISKFLLGVYFGAAEPGSTYGAAGSIILVLLWVSYSCLIFFYGAEFTKVFSIRYGYGIIPKKHYSRVKKKESIEQGELIPPPQDPLPEGEEDDLEERA